MGRIELYDRIQRFAEREDLTEAEMRQGKIILFQDIRKELSAGGITAREAGNMRRIVEACGDRQPPQDCAGAKEERK